MKWVLGVSANGKGSGLPNTYAYWTGSFDGSTFTADATDPQWLDHGWDWYGAVTFEKRDASGALDAAARYAIGWVNNWDYANTTPTIDCDGFNGTDSIVREITLKKASDSTYYLASQPVAGLDSHVSRTVNLGDVTVDGTKVLDYTGIAYEVTDRDHLGPTHRRRPPAAALARRRSAHRRRGLRRLRLPQPPQHGERRHVRQVAGEPHPVRPVRRHGEAAHPGRPHVGGDVRRRRPVRAHQPGVPVPAATPGSRCSRSAAARCSATR